jgi:ATP synthase protein I
MRSTLRWFDALRRDRYTSPAKVGSIPLTAMSSIFRTLVSTVPGRIVLWQCLVGFAGAALWSLAGLDAALAALLGGISSAVLSLHFAIRVFARKPGSPPGAMLGAFYRAEAFKLIAAMAIFAVAAKFYGHVFVPLVTTFVATLTVYWFALLWKLDPVLPEGHGKSGSHG